jgi:hypothetical protein
MRVSHQSMARAGWVRVDDRPWSKCAARWLHRDGWMAIHCGHPTALHQWCLYDPDGAFIRTGSRVGRPDCGTAWDTLVDVVEFVSSMPARPSPRPDRCGESDSPRAADPCGAQVSLFPAAPQSAPRALPATTEEAPHVEP